MGESPCPSLSHKPVSPSAPPNSPESPKESLFPNGFPAEKQLFFRLLATLEGLNMITDKDMRERVKAEAAFLGKLDPDSPLMQAALWAGEGTVNTSEAASAGSMAASMMEGATTETDHHRPRKQAQGMLTAALLTMPQGSRSCRVSNILEEEEEEFKS